MTCEQAVGVRNIFINTVLYRVNGSYYWVVTIALLEMGFSFPQVHILHDRGLHIWEACNNVIIICLLYMDKTNIGRYIYTRPLPRSLMYGDIFVWPMF